MSWSRKRDHGIEKEIMKVTKENEDKKVKWRCGFNNKLIIFTYYLKLFLTLSHTIKLFYQVYLTYIMT